jgi:hypothetical protein
MNSPFDGVWEGVADTPLGAQKVTLTLTSVGGTLTGSIAGAMGTVPLQNGTVEGTRATWRMQVKGVPLSADVTVTGDQIAGGISAPGFGTSPIQGRRQS